MISLSERFGHNKAVAVDSADSETDFSDDSLFPKKSLSTYNYSDTPPLLFTANLSSKTSKDSQKEDLEEDTDDDCLDMQTDWIEHFQKVLQKSMNISDKHGKHVSLSDHVPEIDTSLPLEYLKNSIDKYNSKNSNDKLSNDVNDNFAANCDLIFKRNENELDFFEDDVNVPCEKGIKIVDFKVETDTEVKVLCGDLESAKKKKDYAIPSTSKPVKGNEETNKSLENALKTRPDANEETNLDLINISNEVVESGVRLNALYKSEINETDELVISFAQQSASKSRQCKNKNDVEKHSGEKQICQSLESKTKDVFEHEQQHSVIPDVKETKANETVPKEILRRNQNSEINNGCKTKPEVFKEANMQNSDVQRGMDSEEVCNDQVNNTEELVYLISLNDLTEPKSHKKGNKSTNTDTVIDASLNKDQEKADCKKMVSQIATEGEKISQKSNKDQLKSSTVSLSKKVLAKVKTLEIKPTYSFPLDELLPPVQSENVKAAKDNKSEMISDNKEKQHFQTNEAGENLLKPHLFNEADVFHGIVYDNSPSEEIHSEEYQLQHGNFQDHNRMAQAETSGVSTNTKDLDTGMENLIAALQSGDQQVVTLFQTALHDQIGLNLEALAAKARSGCQVTPRFGRGETSSFGFYTERESSYTNDPDQTGDNDTNEKCDELFALLVEQCSALVKTEEDSTKLKALLKLLQTESEIKLTKNEITSIPEMDTKTRTDKNASIQKENSLSCQPEIDLFEGRTLLKGGVEPRHIPKTTIKKPGLERPKDPRVNIFHEKCEPQVKLPLPEFALELYGEKKVKRILHLDWDAHFRSDGTVLSSANEKDPRIKRLPPCDSQIKLLGDAEKLLVENPQVSKETLRDKNVQEKKAVPKIQVKSQFLKDDNLDTIQEKTLESNSRKKTETVSSNAIPVLITPQKETDFDARCVKGTERNSVLHCIDLQKSFMANDTKYEKKINVGVVKPLIDKQANESKPSVGIVKPMQLKTFSVKKDTHSKRDITTISSKQAEKNKTSLDYKCGSQEKAFEDRVFPLKTNLENDPIVIESDSEEGEIRFDDGKSGTISHEHKNTLKICDSKLRKEMISEKVKIRKAENSRIVCARFSDKSNYEDGEIDTLLEKSFHEKVSAQKESKDQKKSSRVYRKRERSSSRSSVESRMSHSSYSSQRIYCKQTSSGNSLSREKLKRNDRSRSREKSWKRSSSRERSSSNQKQRHRHHTSRDDYSNRDYSYKSKTSKRHHSLDNENRRRHKTEGDCKVSESNKKKYKTQDYLKSEFSSNNEGTSSRKSLEKTRISQTASYKYDNDEDSASDRDLAKEYREIFGKTKQQSFNSFDKSTKLSNAGFYKLELEKPSKSVKLGTSRGTDFAENEFSYQGTSKTRRKSSEEIQKEVLEDKIFLENCKKKIFRQNSDVNQKMISCENSGIAISGSAQSIDLEEGEL